MLAGQFSRTAIVTAALRAAHQTVDSASVFVDPLAASALGDDDAEALRRAGEPARRQLRLFIALRSRIAEDVAQKAIGEGARQIVVLGAGLDTFAYRLAAPPGLAVFEVDHPATQAEKRRRFELKGVAAPDHLRQAPCDFETQTLARALFDAGFDRLSRAAFLWLGVVPYLTPDAVEATLRLIAENPGGTDVVFDYANPTPGIASPETRRYHEEMAERVARAGEPFRCAFETAKLHDLLKRLGFTGVDDHGPVRIAQRLSAAARTDDRGGHIVHAWARR